MIILNVVREFASGDDYDCDEPPVSGYISYATHFFETFSQKATKQRNNNFMYMVADQANDMIEDDNLGAKELRKTCKEYLDLKS